MNKEQAQELMMGAALVMLAYAAYRHFKPAATATAGGDKRASAPTGQPLQNYAISEPSQQYTGNQLTRLDDLLTGTTHDIGGFNGEYWLNSITNPILMGEGNNGPRVSKDEWWYTPT